MRWRDSRTALVIVGLAGVLSGLLGLPGLLGGDPEPGGLPGGAARLLDGAADPPAVRERDLGLLRTLRFRAVDLDPGEPRALALPAGHPGGAVRWVEARLGDGAPFVDADTDGGFPARGRDALGGWVRVPPGAVSVSFRAREGATLLGEPVFCPAGRPGGPDVLLITIDTLRRDALSIHGAPAAVSPRLAELARSSHVFDDAATPCTWTLPAFAGLFTGRHPLSIGAGARDSAIPDSVRTLAEALAEAGYVTHAVAQNVMLSADGGFARGFDAWDFFAADDDTLRPAARVAELAADWLRTMAPIRGRAPLFLWAHFFDPHSTYDPSPEDLAAVAPRPASAVPGPPGAPVPPPFDPPGPFEDQRRRALATDPPALERVRALYRAEVRATDRAIGALLDAAGETGILERALVVVVSDHGESLGEEGAFGHGHSVAEELVRVPLIVRFPGAPEGARVAAAVSILDVAPTIVELAGAGPLAPASDPASGRSLAGAARGDLASGPAEAVFAGLFPELPPARGLREGGGVRAVDAASAPDRLARWAARTGGAPVAPEPSPAPDAETEARLRALGYAD